MTHDSAPALHTCLPIYHAHVLLTGSDTRFITIYGDHTCLHSWDRTGREAPAHNDTDYSRPVYTGELRTSLALVDESEAVLCAGCTVSV